MATAEELTKAANANGVNTGAANGTTSTTSTTTTSQTDFSTNKTSPVASPSDRANAIGTMYDKNIESQKVDLMNAYNKNMSTAEAQKENISKNYDQQRNDLSAQYEKNRRNNNMQAANNGLNTGAGSQAQLAQSNAYLGNLSRLGASEATQQSEADRNIANLKINLQNDMAKASAAGEYQKAAAMLDEYQQQYTRAQTEAKELATFGDFSGWAKIVGPEEAAKMQQSWGMQNPDMAVAQGIITEDQYFDMTGKHSNNYNRIQTGAAGAVGGGGGGGLDPGTYWPTYYYNSATGTFGHGYGGDSSSSSSGNVSDPKTFNE